MLSADFAADFPRRQRDKAEIQFLRWAWVFAMSETTSALVA
jgi:hypothetical protein